MQQSLNVATVFKLVCFCCSVVFTLSPETVAVLMNGEVLQSLYSVRSEE